MILILGGTTEGRQAAATLEEAGEHFYYSTRGEEQAVKLHHGTRLTGGMNREEMCDFCQLNQIRLLIDAAHPFAEQLHQTVKECADLLQIPVIRYERIYPEEISPQVIRCRDYTDAILKIQQAKVKRLVALTGVQTIRRLQTLWQSDIECYFRILDRDRSRQLVKEAGFPLSHIGYYQLEQDDSSWIRQLQPDALLTKESGLSGGFLQKAALAHELHIQLFVIARPKLPDSFIPVNGPHGLRRAVEQAVPSFFPLKSGLTTGSCATAAAAAATYNLFGYTPTTQLIRLPDGESIPVKVETVSPGKGFASVCKEAGDDPDITDGIELRASIQRKEEKEESTYRVELIGGEGIGRVTLPGMGLPIGAPAINSTPQKMIQENVTEALQTLRAPAGLYSVTLSIPRGKELATRTFNPRLGIVGGLSIIGTSGIVKPFSTEAFIQSIQKSMEVACATQSPFIVINSGAKSEQFLHRYYPELPTQAFVHYGNFIGETLRIATEQKVPHLIMGLMIGKAVKLAEGFLDTHSKQTTMNKQFIQEIAVQAGCEMNSCQAIEKITLARELWTLFSPSDQLRFAHELLRRCQQVCKPLFPVGELTIVLITEQGEIIR